MRGIHIDLCIGRTSRFKALNIKQSLVIPDVTAWNSHHIIFWGQKVFKTFSYSGLSELRRLIFIEQLLQIGNLHCFSSLKKKAKNHYQPEMKIASPISTTKQSLKQIVNIKKNIRPSQNNLHLIRQSRQSGCNNIKNFSFSSCNILFLAAKMLHSQGEHTVKFYFGSAVDF